MSEIIKKIEGHYNKYGNYIPSRVIIRCDCGNQVFCDSFTNTCYKCNRDYGPNGNRLAPRNQWGLETNESLADILGPENEGR